MLLLVDNPTPSSNEGPIEDDPSFVLEVVRTNVIVEEDVAKLGFSVILGLVMVTVLPVEVVSVVIDDGTFRVLLSFVERVVVLSMLTCGVVDGVVDTDGLEDFSSVVVDTSNGTELVLMSVVVTKLVIVSLPPLPLESEVTVVGWLIVFVDCSELKPSAFPT